MKSMEQQNKNSITFSIDLPDPIGNTSKKSNTNNCHDENVNNLLPGIQVNCQNFIYMNMCPENDSSSSLKRKIDYEGFKPPRQVKSIRVDNDIDTDDSNIYQLKPLKSGEQAKASTRDKIALEILQSEEFGPYRQLFDECSKIKNFNKDNLINNEILKLVPGTLILGSVNVKSYSMVSYRQNAFVLYEQDKYGNPKGVRVFPTTSFKGIKINHDQENNECIVELRIDLNSPMCKYTNIKANREEILFKNYDWVSFKIKVDGYEEYSSRTFDKLTKGLLSFANTIKIKVDRTSQSQFQKHYKFIKTLKTIKIPPVTVKKEKD